MYTLYVITMAQTKRRGKYLAASLPIDFIEEVRSHVLDSSRYRSIAEFVKIAAMNQMDKDKTLNR